VAVWAEVALVEAASEAVAMAAAAMEQVQWVEATPVMEAAEVTAVA
jgi:hypothetical protein